MGFDHRHAFEHVRNLSFPRLVGSPGEKKAREYIISYFKNLGLEVETQSFRFSPLPWEAFLRLSLLMQSGIIILGAWLLPRLPSVSVILSLLLLIATASITRWGFLFEAFDREGKKESINIIARMGKGNPRVVYMAHYDSKAQVFPLPLRFGLFLLGFLLMAGMSLTITILAFFPGRPDLLPLALVAAVPNILLQFNFTNNASDGALDNAAGIGILLELARLWQRGGGGGRGRLITGWHNQGEQSEQPPWQGSGKDTEIMFVATGAEELGLLGAIRFIIKYAPSLDLKSTYFVNLDGPGAKGRIIYVTGFGIPPVRTCNKLRAIAGEIVKEKGLPARDSTLLVGAALDIIPVAARGYEAISISSGALSKPFLAVHSKNDRIENVDPETLGRCGELAYEIALRL